MSFYKDVLKAAARRTGYAVTRIPDTPYPALAKVPRYVECEVDLAGRPFRVTDAASFLASFREIFVDEIYDFRRNGDAPVIIDCGANTGVGVAYFKHRHPDARVTAVEADPAVFDVLSTNVAAGGFDGVTLINKAVSHSPAPVQFHSEGADGGRVHHLNDPLATSLVQTVTLDDLIQEPVDFLKIDIEGAETEVLKACSKLDLVRQMFVEYHSFADSEQTLTTLLDVIAANGFRYYIHTQLCSPAPLTVEQVHMGMDLQLNIFARRAAG